MRLLTSLVTTFSLLGHLGIGAAAGDTLNQLKQLNYDDRALAYNKLPSNLQAEFWVEKLVDYRQKHSESLRRNQLDALDQAIEIAKTRDETQFSTLKSSMLEAFEPRTAKMLVASLRTEDDGQGKRDETSNGNASQNAPVCNCSVDHGYCEICPHWSTGVEHACITVDTSCGTLGFYMCDGLCHDPPS